MSSRCPVRRPKTLVTEHRPVRVNTPRDREGGFEPKLVRKRQRRFEGFDGKILALYARGMSTRDIEAHRVRDILIACREPVHWGVPMSASRRPMKPGWWTAR